ncbi:hypothetical protein POM88_045082 [Heracleum sosnowskyi]|uniref:Uncharacterized protein n=1 Tax=Heracleum sosnowskyi TaxID=360622 RepID=A0AAD8H5T8_9APIA|nr:hypothetical protein POM88_045082 [Heracleum sosnowskyi]
MVSPEPKKKRDRRTKTIVSQAAVSQQTVVSESDSNTSLDVPSQQGASIEIGMSPKAPSTESAQTHGSQPEEPPLAETHSELGHSDNFSIPIDGSHVSPVNQPPLSTTLSPSSFSIHSFVSSPQPREGYNPNPSGFDHPSPIMDEPPSSGPQEPISQNEMDITPPNTEQGQSSILPENETANTLSELQGASYLQKDAVTASVALKDTGNVAVLDTTVVMGGEKATVNTEPTVTPHPKDVVMTEPAVHAQADSNIPAKDAVQSSQPDFDAVTIEDASDDDLPLAKLLKVHSKSSTSMHVSTAHTHAFRLSEGVQKKREIKEKRGEHKNERQPNELAKGEGLEHVQRDLEGAHTIQALGLESQTVRSDEITQKHPESVRTPIASKPLSFPSPPRRLMNGGPYANFGNRIEALEGQCATLHSKLDSLSQLLVDGFAATQLSIQFLTDLVPANSTKGEKVARSESISIQESGGTQGEPVTVKTKGGSKQVSGIKSEAMTKGEQVKPSSEQPKDKVEDLVEVDLDGEKVLISEATQDAMQRRPASRHPILPPVTIREPTSATQETALQKRWREMEEQNKLGKGKGKLPESIYKGNTWSNGTEFDQEEANTIMVNYRESTLHNHDTEFSSVVEEAMNAPSNSPTNTTKLLKDQIISVSVMVNDEKRWVVSIYFTSGISYFITMKLLQSLPAKVLCAMKGKIKATQTPFNETLNVQIQNMITQKLPEVYTNPPCVFYRSTTKDGTRRNSYMNFISPSRMQTETILKVLYGILISNANPGRVFVVQEIYKMLVLRDKALGARVKELITRANAKRADQGRSCLYDIPFQDDDDDEIGGGEASGNAGNAGGSNSGNTGIQSQNEGNEETPSQEKKDADATDEEEPRILEALEASILRYAIDCINA